MDDVIEALKAQTANGNMHAWAKQHGIAYAYVWRVANGVSPPSEKICKAVGFTKATTYERVRS